MSSEWESPNHGVAHTEEEVPNDENGFVWAGIVWLGLSRGVPWDLHVRRSDKEYISDADAAVMKR